MQFRFAPMMARRARAVSACFCGLLMACSSGDDDNGTSGGFTTLSSGGVGSDGLTTASDSDAMDGSEADDGAPTTTAFTTDDSDSSTTDPSTSSTTDSGGTSDTGDSTTTTTGSDGDCDLPASDMIDDFEDANGELLLSNGRQGFWYIFNDGSAGGTQTPAENSVFPESGGACGTGFSMRTTGSGFSEWGAGLGIDLNNAGGAGSLKMPWNASAYTGIVVMARGSGQVRANVQISATVPTAEGGTCAADCDPHGMNITLQSQWQQYVIPFNQLSQEGWGTAATWDATSAIGIQFKVGPNQTLDLTIDEIGFY